MSNESSVAPLDRRKFLARCSALGLTGSLLPGVLWTKAVSAADGRVTSEMVAASARISGLEFDEDELEQMARGINGAVRGYEAIRELKIPNSVAPALDFNPILPGMTFDTDRKPFKPTSKAARDVPSNLEDVAFWPVTDLAALLRERKVSSLDLTKMYLARLKRYDPVLKCVITLTEELALEQATRADREISSGKYRGPLHGIPWGAKDLLAVKGYRTTWGAMPYKDQVFETNATVVTRLEEAGAVLVAKLTMGALAEGDVWYDGKTRSPWNPERGSSGSSAGPGSATAAGLVGFAIGTETNGSITSPSTVNGVTGLRPTYGRVSRHGAMALSWSLDKIGPMCRSVEDCALVFNAILGPDGVDSTLIDMPFNWDPEHDVRELRVGYVPDAFRSGEKDTQFHQRTLATLRGLGVDLKPITLPEFPTNALRPILTVESAAAFEELTLSNRDDLLVSQTGWPRTFRQARMVPAVEYVQANRARRLLMEAMEESLKDFDVYVVPTGHKLFMGNLTGHPLIVLPSGIREGDRPTSMSFLGRLYGEAKMMRLAKAFQDATNYHLQYPPVGNWEEA